MFGLSAQIQSELQQYPKRWLVTGAAGFIGSHLSHALLDLGQEVIGFDNFSTGKKENVRIVKELAKARADKFDFREGDIRDYSAVFEACRGADFVLHQAALGSVPRSIDDPVATHEHNVSGFLSTLMAARDAKVSGFVYASSSAIYGDEEYSPKVEGRVGVPLSPYAASKAANELYAGSFWNAYKLSCVGLRYFNVFGPRQDPHGAYAAVIPKWVSEVLAGGTSHVNGDGETSRDFCYVENVVQGNILAAMKAKRVPGSSVYNIACGATTSLNQLFNGITDALKASGQVAGDSKSNLQYGPFRTGDVRHSLADISRACNELGYSPEKSLNEGLTAMFTR